jgi:glutathione peroxidase-family protein
MLMGVGCAGVSGEGHKKDFLDLAAIRLVDLDGKPIMLTTYQNQVLLIDFFATWSQSTSIIVPAYIQLYRHYQPCGLAMVGIALDDLGAKVVKPFVAGMGIPYPVALSDKDMREGRSPFGTIEFVPLLLVVGRDGRMVNVFAGLTPIATLEKAIQGALGKACPGALTHARPN